MDTDVQTNPAQWHDRNQAFKFRVALDIDGVLGNYLDAFTRLVYGRPLPEPSSYHVWEDPAWPCADEDAFLKDHASAVAKGLYHVEPCITSAAWSSQRLVTGMDGIEVDVVTSRRDDAGTVTMDWLLYHAIAFDHVVHVRHPEQKAELGYDLVVDDDPLVLRAAMDAGALALAPRMPWTRNIGCHLMDDGRTIVDVVESAIAS